MVLCAVKVAHAPLAGGDAQQTAVLLVHEVELLLLVLLAARQLVERAHGCQAGVVDLN